VPAAAATTAPVPAAAAVSDVSGSLTVWHYFNTDGKKSILTVWQDMFNKLYPKVEVKYVYVEFQELSKRVIAAAGAKQGRTCSSMVALISCRCTRPARSRACSSTETNLPTKISIQPGLLPGSTARSIASSRTSTWLLFGTTRTSSTPSA
jgi:hypothetical protein